MITRKSGGKRVRMIRYMQRKGPHIEPKPLVLIVCEGKETEPNYFHSIRKDYKLNKKRIEIVGGDKCGTDPKSVVEYAKKRKMELRKDKLEYESIWCVYDRDEHQRFNDANVQARDLKFKVTFSNPCFELWYLLHFQDQDAPIERDEVIKSLKPRIPDYDKTTDYYEKLKKCQNEAIIRAEKLREKHRRENSEETKNPSTSVDLLVKYLNSISNS